MCNSCRAKHCIFTTVWIMAAVFSVIGSNYAQAGPINPPHSQTGVIGAGQPFQAASTVNSACDKIFTGDFESAQQILGGITASDSQDLIQLRKIVNEYTIINARRKALQDKAYQIQINEL